MTPHEAIIFQRQKTTADIAAGNNVCPVCSREVKYEFVPLLALEKSLEMLIRANAPDTKDFEAVCKRCVRLFERAQEKIVTQAAMRKDGSHVLSTPLRLDAAESFTGKGITIAFLDSGFYPHPDLISPVSRIIAYRNMASAEGETTTLHDLDVASWHGMMTSVVAAGNGFLSKGFYRGIAPESNVALVKLARSGRITDRNIQDGLEWVLENRTRYGISIVNISAGGDFENSYLHDELSQTVEEAVKLGLTIVCAVGNAGHLPTHPVIPPASSPACIAVGGLDDSDSINRAKRGMYRSSYGPTIDGLQKPEIIAPSIWVPAPILPNTPTALQVRLLETLDKAPNEKLYDIIMENPGISPALDAALEYSPFAIRQLITTKRRYENVITEHYKYVDGTSFAAPIVSSIIAQMLEANPYLTPQQIKKILINSAERLPHYEVDRQGWGVIDPRTAVEKAVEAAY